MPRVRKGKRLGVRRRGGGRSSGSSSASASSSSSSSSSARNIFAANKARRQAREKLLRQLDAEGPVYKAKLVLPRSPPKDVVAEEKAKWARWQKQQEARKRSAAAKIAKMLRKKVLRKKLAARIAQRKLSEQRKRISSLKAKARRVQERTAARKIVRTLRRAVVRRRQLKARATRAAEELAQARRESSSSRSSMVGGGGGSGNVGRSSSSSSQQRVGTSAVMKVIARLVAKRMGARKPRMIRRTGKRCRRGTRRIRRTGFCATKSFIARLPRLPRRRRPSPPPDAPKDVERTMSRHCPKGYRRLRRRQDGKRVKVAICRKRT